MAKRSPAGSTPALTVLQRAGVAHTVRSYTHDPRAESYGLEAAQALEVEPERVFKTLLVDTSEGLAVGIVPVTNQLDLKAMARALGTARAAMAGPAAAQRATGYVLGGISPLGQRRAHPTVLDETADLWPTILVSAGRRGLDVELAPADLIGLTGASLADIAR